MLKARQVSVSRPRRAATSRPQANPHLPPAGALVADADGARVQCHACGRWYANLGAHARRAHGLGGDDYRARYPLAWTLPLIAPALAARHRAAALARDQGRHGRARWPGARDGGRPKGRETRLSTRIASSQARVTPRPAPPPPARPRPRRGAAHPNAKLTAAQVAAIRRRFAAGGVTRTQLAGEHGVSARLIGLIVAGRAWREAE